MELDLGFIVVLAGAFAALALMIANMIVASKHGEESPRITKTMYVVALITIGINIARLIGNPGSGYIIAGNFLALGAIFASHKRYRVQQWERRQADAQRQSENSAGI